MGQYDNNGVFKISQIEITKKQARQFILAYQNLLPPRQLEKKKEIVEFIKKVGCIQFDPLDKVGYNPHLVLQSRYKNYSPKLLEELLYDDRKLVDGWDKNMSIYSVEDWPYFQRNRDKAKEKYEKKTELVNEIIPKVRKEIEAKGPLSSIDLDFDKKVDWSWAPTRAARAALESMYSWGELIIYNKIGSRKVYDFTEKYLSDDILLTSDPNKTQQEYYKWYVKRRISSIGLLWSLSGGAWLGIDGLKKKERVKAISELLEEEEIKEVKIKGLKNTFYINRKDIGLLNKIMNGIEIEPEVSFIAPLDNILWDRKLLKRIFDFEYVWEVYKPVSERQYGYYVLPVLYGDEFVARFEPEYDKENKELIIKNWWWEEESYKNEEFKNKLDKSYQNFLNYLGGNDINIKEQNTK